MFEPAFRLTPAITKALMEIEASRKSIEELPVDVEMLASLRETARLMNTHYSTRIEGNRLTSKEVEAVVRGGESFSGRERDEEEVRCYYLALEEMERLAREHGSITEEQIQEIHSLVMYGRKRATPYRDGQNVIRDGHGGGIVYLPPEAEDVPGLMRELVLWINREMRTGQWPTPVISAIAHCQFATIHPYYDGNGRTARLLATLILHRGGYGLNGIYALEEYYAENLRGYYDALTLGESHNYYFGRAEADVSGFVAYFCLGMAEALAKIRAQAQKAAERNVTDRTLILRELSSLQRKALSFFLHSRTATTREIADFLGLKIRRARSLFAEWVKEGFLVIDDPSKKARSYKLAPEFEKLVTSRV